jgi:hypothetical protein
MRRKKKKCSLRSIAAIRISSFRVSQVSPRETGGLFQAPSLLVDQCRFDMATGKKTASAFGVFYRGELALKSVSPVLFPDASDAVFIIVSSVKASAKSLVSVTE